MTRCTLSSQQNPDACSSIFYLITHKDALQQGGKMAIIIIIPMELRNP